MTDEERYIIISNWYGRGLITPSDRDLIRADYIERENIVEGCTTCPQFWHLLFHHYRFYFRSINNPIMAQRKFMVADGGSFMLPGENVIYVNEGVESEFIRVLSDDLATEILRRYPDFKHQIVKNPDYAEKKAALPKETADLPVARKAAALKEPSAANIGSGIASPPAELSAAVFE